MKCPRCWAQKAYLRPAHGWKTALLSCLLFRSMKCHHCYHKFHVHWLLTLGKRVEPPILRVTRTSQPTGGGVPERRDVSPNHFDDQQQRADAA